MRKQPDSIMPAHGEDGRDGLLLAAGPLETAQERRPVSSAEKVEFLPGHHRIVVEAMVEQHRPAREVAAELGMSLPDLTAD
ncbi:hypothetical protein [Amycolatopsis sp. lyj-84]|uniref:hypothetical protein n=1 Tax=Amycolatopsis sp. lyj-84 TaxID=2789284 RepID=UPI00397D6359